MGDKIKATYPKRIAGGTHMEYLLLIGVLAKYIIIGLASLVGAVVFLRKAIKNEEHRVRNIILAIAFFLLPILGYAFLYILGSIITG